MSTATVNLAEISSIWRNARHVYPIYSAINQHFNLGMPPCRDLDSPIDRSDFESCKRIQEWLDKMDSLMEVHQIRQLLQTTHIAGEEGLAAMLKRQLAKPEKNNAIRDKVDYLMVQYYAYCAPHDAHNLKIDHDHVSEILHPVLGDVSPLLPDFCADLDQILTDLDRCACLGDLLQNKVIDRARAMKDRVGMEYFKPSVLVAYTRFNFLLRRGFFRLMHADLHAIRFAIHAMEARGQHSCDCTAAGLTKDHTFSEIREICHDWKKPFRAAYSLGNTFSQLVSIRAAVESEMTKPYPAPAPVVVAPAAPAPPVAAVPQPVRSDVAAAGSPKAVPVAPAVQSPVPAAPAVVKAPAPTVETVRVQQVSAIDACIHQINDVLTKSKAKTAAVSNFVLGGTKVVFASWEVAAFVTPLSEAAPQLRRAVASRVLLLTGIEARKRGEGADISGLISQARVEAAQLQAQIAAAKDRKDIDTAVNLAATAKRLLALLDQTEKTT